MLTYSIRCGDKENFEYLLNRGISILKFDKKGNNCLHFAINIEKLDIIAYLTERNYEPDTLAIILKDPAFISDTFYTNKAHLIH